MSRIGHERHRAARYAESARAGVAALYPGICHCGERWGIGDRIVKRGSKWMHAACGETDDE